MLPSLQFFLSLSSLITLLLLLFPTSSFAQFTTYNAGPRLWHTFDVEPPPIVYAPNTTSFTWSRGLQPHEGTVLFNGVNDFIDLYVVRDDYGRTLPRTLPRSVSFEWWVKWNGLNSYSRILDCGNGVYSDNIIVNNQMTTNDLRAAFYRGSTSVNQLIIAPRAIHPNTWQHVVVTIRQKQRGDTSSAEIDVYVDGQLVVQQVNALLPNQIARANCWIGKSEWVADGYFYGWIDDFFWYDFPLGQEEVLAHYVLPRPPVYELTFSHDPRLIQNPNQNLIYTYLWTDRDEGDTSNITKYHNGHLFLTGDMHIDLEAATGNSSIGANALPVIGGNNSGANGTLPMGWTIEVLFKALTVESFADLLDFSNGPAEDNIIIGWSNVGTALIFDYYVGSEWGTQFNILNTTRNNTWSDQSHYTDIHHVPIKSSAAIPHSLTSPSSHTPVPNPSSCVRYHVIVVMSPGATQAGNRIIAYVNGNQTAMRGGIPLPRGVPRSQGYIGKSPWGLDYFDCYLDTFRLYDYSLTAQEVHELYIVTHEELPNATAPGVITHGYHTAPVSSYTFTRRPTEFMVEGTKFQWDYIDFKFPHERVALFNGANEYINLAAYPSNAAGHPLGEVGGAFSIECWVMWDSFRLYSRIIDIGSYSGYAAHNIILANQGRTNNLMFEVYSGSVASQVLVTDALETSEWVHIVASVEQRFVNDSFSGQSGILRLYINGVERGSQVGYLPQLVLRPNAFIARSNWPADEYFGGKIDALYFYDTALTTEQVAAHYLTPRPPVFELAFNRDPRPWVTGGGAGPLRGFDYEWQEFDAADFINNSTQHHNGHLVLVGNPATGFDAWVNLTATSGPHSIGTALTDVLFGAGSGATISDGARYYGWTIEILVKIEKQEVGAKLFDFGAGRFQDNVGMGFWDSRSRLNMYTYGGPDGKQGLAITIIDEVVLHQWYHIVVVMKHSATAGLADVLVYVNGEAPLVYNDYLHYPRAVHRPNCYLAKSAWVEDDYMDLKLDTFRVYDIALTQEYAQSLYRLTVSDTELAQEPLWHAGPLLSYTFDAPPNQLYLTGGTSFIWEQGVSPRTGLATFDGVSEWINLMTFPDDSGRSFPTVIGNQSFSFEAWVRYDELRDWSRIIDLGNSEAGDNILIANKERTGRLEFHVYMSYNNTLLIGGTESTGLPLTTGTWHHVVATLDDLTKYPANRQLNPVGPQAAWLSVYVDGALWGEGAGPRPRAVARTQAYMGKSHWGADALFKGRIDSLFYYDFALSIEQVNVHKAVPRPPVFDLAFDSDPRWWLGGVAASYTYSWQDFDPSDAFNNATRFHSGHLVLDGSSRERSYVNLSALTGYSSIGLGLPRIGGGQSVATGGQLEGWSFEVVVKLSTVGKWAKLLDWGRPAAPGWALDNIVIGYLETSNTLEFRVWNSLKGNDMSTYVNITAVNLNQWYHIVVVVTPIGSILDYNARYDAYVDGVRTNSNLMAYYPVAKRRDSALIGRTNWGYSDDAPFACKLDALRVYDYALPAYVVRELYNVVHSPNAIPPSHISSSVPPVVHRSSSSSTAAPAAATSRAITSAPATSRPPSSSSTSVRRFSSSSSSPLKKCASWAKGGLVEPDCQCPFGGTYPNRCRCPDGMLGTMGNCYEDDEGESSSTGVPAPAAAGPSSALIAGIVVALIAVAAVLLFVYFKYFKTDSKGGLGPGTTASTHTGKRQETGDGEKLSSSLLGGHTGDSGADYHQHSETNGNGKHSTSSTANGVEML